MQYERLPLGPIALACVVGAVIFAFLQARTAHEARRHRTTEPPDEESEDRVQLSARGPYYTPEGERLLERARRFGRLFYLFALGALVATWFRV